MFGESFNVILSTIYLHTEVMDKKNLADLLVFVGYIHICTSLPTGLEGRPQATRILLTSDTAITTRMPTTIFKNLITTSKKKSENDFDSNEINILTTIATLYERAAVAMQSELQEYRKSGLYTPDQYLTTNKSAVEMVQSLSNVSYAMKTAVSLGCESILSIKKINASVQYRRKKYQKQFSNLRPSFANAALNHINNVVQLSIVAEAVKCDNQSDEIEASRLLDYNVMAAMKTLIGKFQIQSRSLKNFVECDLHGKYKRLRSRADASIREALTNYCDSSVYDKSSSLIHCGEIFSNLPFVRAERVCVNWDIKRTYEALCKAKALLNETRHIIHLRDARTVNVNYTENAVMNMFHILQLDSSCNRYTTSGYISCDLDIQVCFHKIVMLFQQVEHQQFT